MTAEEIWLLFCNNSKISWEWVLSPQVHKNKKEQSKSETQNCKRKTDRVTQGDRFVRFRLIQGRLKKYQFCLIMILSNCSLSNSNLSLQAPGMTTDKNLKLVIFPYS